MRVKKGFKARRRRNRVLKRAKGFRGRRKNAYRRDNQAVERARNYRRREFRALWIVRINAAARANGTTYSKLVGALKKAGIVLDRKVLAELALALPTDFAAVVRVAQA